MLSTDTTERIGSYRILRCLGRTGFRSVYLAAHPEGEELVALKVGSRQRAREDADQDALRREARLAQRIESPHVARVIDLDADPGLGAFYSMEYVRGATLAEELARRGPLTPLEVRTCGQQLADALGAAHAAGVRHGDVRPQNFIVSEADGQTHLTLIDFGSIASIDGPSSDGPSHASPIARRPYAAPEVLLGAPEGTASDVYAVGVMMFELLTDELPYESYDRASVADRVARRTPPPSVRERNRLVPEGLSDAVSACLALEPDERPRDMAALRERLDDWAEQPSVTPAPLPRPRKTARTSVASVAASLAILGAIGVAVGRTPARVANSAAATVARQVPAALERRPQPPIRAEEPDEDAVEADEDERRERERQQREL